MRKAEREAITKRVKDVMRKEPHRTCQFFVERFGLNKSTLQKFRKELGLGPFPVSEYVTAGESNKLRQKGRRGKRASQDWVFYKY